VERLAEVIEPGLSYDGTEPVRIHMRTRDRRIDLDDGGRAVDVYSALLELEDTV
jgi:hypothetical protein